jgi:hypothetical protein
VDSMTYSPRDSQRRLGIDDLDRKLVSVEGNQRDTIIGGAKRRSLCLLQNSSTFSAMVHDVREIPRQ